MQLFESYRKKLVLSIIFMIVCKFAVAQQNIQYTQYMYDGSFINPAFVGSFEALNISLIHRDQWTGLEGAPQSQSLSAHTLIKSRNVGTGLFIHRETIGVHQNLNATANLAYHLQLGRESFLSAGISAGAFNTSSDYQSLQNSGNDLSIYDEAFTGTDFNMGFGFYFRSPIVEIGYSVPTVLNRSVYINDSTRFDPSRMNHMFFNKFNIMIGDRFELNPSYLVKYTQDLPISYDVNLLLTYTELISTGVSYRANESIDLLLRLQITPQLQIGYAYDYPIGNVNQLSQASNELMLRYLFKFSYGKVKSPR